MNLSCLFKKRKYHSNNDKNLRYINACHKTSKMFSTMLDFVSIIYQNTDCAIM